MSTYTVTAGHGGTDPGAVYGAYREADLMAELRDLVAERLRARGHTVRTDGAGTLNQPLTAAMKLISGADAAIELHTNAAAATSATGVEVISLPPRKALAQRIAAAVAGALGLRLRGDAGWIDQSMSQHPRLGYVVLGGLIVECFFLSNDTDRALYLPRKDLVAVWLEPLDAGDALNQAVQ